MARKLIVEIVGDASKLTSSYKQASKATNGFARNVERSGSGAIKASVAYKGLGRSVGFLSASLLGGAGLVAGIRASVEAASNLAEQTSKAQAVFGPSSKAVVAWSHTTVESMGLASDQALETASSFGALLRPLGLTGEEAARQSTKLTRLGADLASFYNTSVQDALDAIRSGLVGESEPLRRYGVLLSEARVQAEALAETGKKTATQLTAQEKVLARQALILKDARLAAGDFERTSAGLANQQRILSANVRELQIQIGQALIPDLLRAVNAINDWLSSSENQKRVTNDVREAVAALEGAVRAVLPLIQGLASSFEKLSDVLGGDKNAFEALIAAFAAWKVAQTVAKFQALSAAAGEAGAAGSVGLLTTRLKTLGAIGVVTVGIEIAIHGGEITKAIDDALKNAGLGFLVGGGVDAKTKQDLVELVKRGGFGAKVARDLLKSLPGLTDEYDAIENLRSSAEAFVALTGIGKTKPKKTTTTPDKVLKELGLDAFIPANVELALARARTAVAKREALGLELVAINKALGKKLAVEDRIALEAEKTAVLDGIADIDRAATQARQDAAQHQRDLAKKQHEQAVKEAKARAKEIARIAEIGLRGFRIGQKAIAGSITRQRKLAAQQRTKEQREQFRALGLTATGEARTPGVKALTAQLDAVDKAISGTILDTPKLQKRMATVRKLLGGTWGDVRIDVRRAVAGIIEDWKSLTKEQDDVLGRPRFREASAAAMVAALGGGLAVQQKRRLQAQLATIGPGLSVPYKSGAFSGAGATAGVVVNGGLHLYGIQNVRQLENELTKRQTGRPTIRRGAR